MKKKENTKLNRSWMAAFSVATTAFAAHAGGGFATGNQENTWFVSLGWPAIVGVAVAMLLLAMTIREGQIMMNSRGLKTYKELFECLYHPLDKLELLFELFFNIMVLMVVASCISGAASALTQYFGLNYYLGTFVIGLVVLFLTIFGVDLIRRASTYMGVVILVLAVSIYTVGLLNGHNLLDVMRVDFSAHGWSQLPKAACIYIHIKYVRIRSCRINVTLLATLLFDSAKRNNFTNVNNIKIIWSKLACSTIWIGIILMFDFKCSLCHLWICESF